MKPAIIDRTSESQSMCCLIHCEPFQLKIINITLLYYRKNNLFNKLNDQFKHLFMTHTIDF